ncbi:WSC domain-containing protein [Exophiala viscosa]|uniref:WSC domain-containing protein n=1 Tax=Exophiala viscosa TaxID=2486360 RepID=A0AAN6IH89_9EURO|nr:WSC domain-containing protein [Exophiala viscosa]
MANFQHALLAIFLSLSFGNVDAFWRMRCGTVQVGRVDPIISPGGVSGHAHTIAGASNINTTSTYDSLQASFCTSCEIQADKSAYWTPQMYYRHRNGTFEDVPHDGTVVYYLDRGNDVANIKPFPKGIRMLSGDAAARAYDNTTMTWDGSNPVSGRVSFACLSSAEGIPETPALNQTDCDEGLRAQIQFQSCWDGVNLYKSDQSHMDYLSGVDNGNCSPTHPVLLPSLFFEVIYFPNEIDQTDGGYFVFGQGDTTGYGFHGDFLNGWDTTVLEAAMSECMGPNATNDGVTTACPALAAVDDQYFDINCPLQPPVIDEKVTGLLNVLPGCNPPTGGPARATQNICPIQPYYENITNLDYKNRSVATPGDVIADWTYVGCALDDSTPRPLVGDYYTNATGMSIETCTAWCGQKGYYYAGLEDSSGCYCGSALNWPIQNQTVCTQQDYMACAGDLFEFCGGFQLMQIWSSNSYTGPSIKGLPVVGNTTLTVANGTIATYQGCYKEAVGGRALTGKSYINDTTMTIEVCAAFCADGGYDLFGTEYADECYCDNSISTSSIPQNDCDMLCAADETEFCGSGGILSVWSLPGYIATSSSSSGTSSTTPLATNISYIGCYSDGAVRALPSISEGTKMTVDECAQAAQSQNLAYFGLEFASQCYGGRVLSSSSTLLDASSCNMQCAGNSTETCGGPNALSLYNNTAYVKPYNPNPVDVSGNTGTQYSYMGCYLEGIGNRALGSTAKYTSVQVNNGSLTVEWCASYCFANAYAYMGVEDNYQCFCNNAGPINNATLSTNPDADCDMGCAGNPKEICGGDSTLNIYHLASNSKRRGLRSLTW